MPITLGRQTHHLQPMLCWCQLAFGLMWRRCGRDEIDQIQFERLAHFLRGPQVAVMDRIKATAKNSYSHLMPMTVQPTAASPSIGMISYSHLAASSNDVLVGGEFAQSHWSPSVQTIGGDTGLCTEAKLESVGEPCRSVHKNASRIHGGLKAGRCDRIIGDDGVRES